MFIQYFIFLTSESYMSGRLLLQVVSIKRRLVSADVPCLFCEFQCLLSEQLRVLATPVSGYFLYWTSLSFEHSHTKSEVSSHLLYLINFDTSEGVYAASALIHCNCFIQFNTASWDAESLSLPRNCLPPMKPSEVFSCWRKSATGSLSWVRWMIFGDEHK
jgi:hypothetical protein